MSAARDSAAAIVRRLKENGHIAAFAGGCVRDVCLGRTPKDYDVVTSATPDEVERLFPRTIAVGKAFGVIVVVDGNVLTEVATLRSDGQYRDGRRPDSIRFVASLREDAARRDFTINAMFADPESSHIHDFFGGQDDLKEGIIRPVGIAEHRIAADKLRMMHAIRLAARLGFSIAPEMLQAITNHASEIVKVSAERIASELSSILTSANPVMGLDLLMSTGLMQEVLPEVVELDDAEKGKQDAQHHPEGSVWLHTRMVVARLTGSSFELMFGGLLHDVGKPATQWIWGSGRISHRHHEQMGAEIAQVICRRFKLTNAQTRRVTNLVAQHMLMHEVPGFPPSQLVPLLERNDIHDLINLQHADALGRGLPRASHRDFLLDKLQELRRGVKSKRLGAKPLVNGSLLLKLGFRPGPSFKEMIEQGMAAQRNGVFVDNDGAKKWVLAHFTC